MDERAAASATPLLKRPWVRVCVRVLRSVALFLVLLAVAIRILAGGVVFQPTRHDGGAAELQAPAPAGLENVWLTASDGVKIHGWFARGEAARVTLLYFHGNAGNLDDRLGWIRSLSALPADVLAIDYRGYGRSEGVPSEEGFYRDADAAYAHLVAERGVDPARVVIYGKSLGGAPACELATRRSCAGLVLQSTFTSVPDMAGELIPLFPAGWFTGIEFDSLGRIAEIAAPKLIVHSRDDEMIPFWMAERLHAAARDPKRLVAFERSGHNELILAQRDAVLAAIGEFLRDLARGR